MAKINQAMQDLMRYNAAMLPRVRSGFDKSHSHTTTLDSGYLVPLMWDRVVPTDEKKIRYSGLARMATPMHPVMDEAKLDVFAFYIPDRLWWEHAREFYGENKDASFNPDGMYEMPYLKPSQWFTNSSRYESNLTCGIHSLNDYFGFPIGFGSGSNIADYDKYPEFRATAGLHRCYQICWNEYFRNSSVQPALRLSTGDNVTDQEWNVIRQIRKVCKYPDFFTSLLKEPQAGEDVILPLGEWAPVVTRNECVAISSVNPFQPVVYKQLDGSSASINGSAVPLLVASNNAGDSYNESKDQLVAGFDDINDPGYNLVAPVNMWADLTNATAATINNLRSAVTIQHLLEISAIGGKRYQQLLQAHFGSFVPDGTIQKPLLLGMTSTPIGMRQVLQTSATGYGDTPQGNTAAVSVTNLANEWICNQSFTEPGFIMVLGCIRPVQSYSQGLDPLLTKLSLYEHYFPVFDHLGNQPVPTSAIFCTYNDDYSSIMADQIAGKTLGYQEAWTEYKIKNNRVSGLMRPDLGIGDESHASLASWNYSVNFSEPPILNSEFVEEDPQLIDRTIAVPSEPQFILDSYFDYKDYKQMSVHSVPGLLRL